MLLQIICSGSEDYLLNLSDVQKREEDFKKRRTRYEIRKDHSDSDDNLLDDKPYTFGESVYKKVDESIINEAKQLYFQLGNLFLESQFISGNISATHKQSVKLSSLYLYLTRLIEPLFDNNLVFISSLENDSDTYPNFGQTDKQTRLKRLLDFMKEEETMLKSYDKDRRSTSADTRDGYGYYKTYDEKFRYEELCSIELDEIEFLKTFIIRCILAFNYIEEISKNSEEFSKAFQNLPDDSKSALKEIQFKHLLEDVSSDQHLKLFTKKLLEVKAQKFSELKEVRRICDEWRHK